MNDPTANSHSWMVLYKLAMLKRLAVLRQPQLRWNSLIISSFLKGELRQRQSTLL